LDDLEYGYCRGTQEEVKHLSKQIYGKKNTQAIMAWKPLLSSKLETGQQLLNEAIFCEFPISEARSSDTRRKLSPLLGQAGPLCPSNKLVNHQTFQ
jgi:hypothetical protein